MLDRAVRACYKALLRQVRDIERSGLSFSLQAPVDTTVWLERGGHHTWAKTGLEYRLQTAQTLLPWMAERLAAVEMLDGGSLRNLVRQEFREGLETASEESPPVVDRALQALRVLGHQSHLARASSWSTTRDVLVEVTAEFVGRQRDLQLSMLFGEEEEEEDDDAQGESSAPATGGSTLYYTYRVRVSNLGYVSGIGGRPQACQATVPLFPVCSKETVQLQGRHWLVQDGDGETVTEVPRGTRGVVGCTPIIKPGTCFQYYSGTDLEHAPGSMRGSFQMAILSDDQQQTLEKFDAEIAPFHFWPPDQATVAA